MFCIEGLKAAGRCARAVCACLCCLICAGPILLIVGLILLVSPNYRQDNVDEYNRAVKAYAAPQGWAGTIGGEKATVQSPVVEVKGNKDGVDDATSTVASASVSRELKTVIYQINTVESFKRSPAYDQEVLRSMSCSSEHGCSSNEMRNKCQGTYRGSGCSSRGPCGNCATTEYLSTYCAVATKVSGGQFAYQEDSSKSSCFYPFTSNAQKYGTSLSSITFQLRASDDPFIALQRITKGDMDFGITATQQRVTGLVLIIIGAILIACICLVGYLAYRLISAALGKKNGSTTTTTNANGATVNVTNTNTTHAGANNDYPPAQPAYPQPAYPQPAYPQQQPYSGYPPPQQQQYPPPQPQPAYGYGQPPPAGQPNYGY